MARLMKVRPSGIVQGLWLPGGALRVSALMDRCILQNNYRYTSIEKPGRGVNSTETREDGDSSCLPLFCPLELAAAIGQ
jgi:hypothetical protein